MIVIVDYGMGNLASVANMFKKVGADATISFDSATIKRADKLILPGVGAFDNGMRNLAERGLIPLLNDQVLRQRKPILGLCLGMQLFTQRSEEGQLPGLGWVDAETVRFKFDAANAQLKVPHMGWNTLRVCQPHPLFAGANDEPRFYFVHSYYVVCHDAQDILAQTQYGFDFASVVGKENILGVQFHPEKSHKFGMTLLKNFAECVWMLRTRAIPCLLLRNRGLVKTIRFQEPKYLGDPINIVKIFNDKEVDELVFLDITATIENKKPPFELLSKITSECFMPLGYGGGVRDLQDVKTLLNIGIEKVALNSYAVENPAFIRAAADFAGSQSIVVSIDVKKNRRNQYEVFTHSGKKATGLDPARWAAEAEKNGAGELLLNSIDRDGTMQGYDLELIKSVSDAVTIPVVACGGAAQVQDLVSAVRQGGAMAAAAGSIFVFQGPHRAVLISYPTPQELSRIFGD